MLEEKEVRVLLEYTFILQKPLRILRSCDYVRLTVGSFAQVEIERLNFVNAELVKINQETAEEMPYLHESWVEQQVCSKIRSEFSWQLSLSPTCAMQLLSSWVFSECSCCRLVQLDL